MNFDMKIVKKFLEDSQKEIVSMKEKLKALKNDIEKFENATADAEGVKTPIWSGNKARLHFLRLRQHYNDHVKVANNYITMINKINDEYKFQDRLNKEGYEKK